MTEQHCALVFITIDQQMLVRHSGDTAAADVGTAGRFTLRLDGSIVVGVVVLRRKALRQQREEEEKGKVVS